MTAQRSRALQSIGFDWEGTNTSWNALLEKLIEYKVQFGHCRGPSKYSANPKLRRWVSDQRRNYRFYQEEKPSAMTEEHIHELESVRFDWGTTAAF
jgi:hypothetical protein